MKPHIRKIIGGDLWMCISKDYRGMFELCRFGDTPIDAFKAWKKDKGLR